MRSRRFASLALTLLLFPLLAGAQDAVTFEMRSFSSKAEADGVTDFHGPTEVLSTPERVAALNSYARYAARFWGDPTLSTPLFTDEQLRERLSQIKPQPLTQVRTTLNLTDWRSCGYKKGKEMRKATDFARWTADGARIQDGCLVLDGERASFPLDSAALWRFRMRFSLTSNPSGLTLVLLGDGAASLSLPLAGATQFEVYGDFQEGTIFVSSGSKTLLEKPVTASFGKELRGFRLEAPAGSARVQQFAFYCFDRQEENIKQPYRLRLVCDEDFRPVPAMEGWARPAYDDSAWEAVRLPSVHGGLAEAGERYYLRTRVNVGDFQYAALELETLDPAGEVWINGEPAAVLRGRVPRHIDVTEYLHLGENTIAVCVKPYYAEFPMHHSPSDLNIGWFLGRATLLLVGDSSRICEALVHTAELGATEALQRHRVVLKNPTPFFRKAQLLVQYYPWFPQEGACVASARTELELRPRVDNLCELDVPLPSPQIWRPGDPHLYRVVFTLLDENGKPIDDCVTTTGVRLIEQKQGVLYINGKPEMLNGAQIFGYRLPVETLSKTMRCASDEQVMRDLVMSRCLGNLLRIHVHTEQGVPEGINDPRYAEWADQMGLYLIWQSPAWLREGEAWNVDIASFPAYMKQVYNHPSIVMWEASNHPNRFKLHAFKETEDYFNSIISTLASVDSSRLLSPTTFWRHSYYANYDGTLDYKGERHTPNPLLMLPKMTRGSQDAYTGYGYNWEVLRNHPYDWAKSCLDAKGLCYFNFEHEESAGQPNWDLARKEPWYRLQSYEWPCEEGSIGRKLDFSEWRASQAFQAFSAWESMKVQTLAGVSGYSWCCIESGPNMFTYQKPLVDPYYVPKLAFYANKMVFQNLWAASDDVDTVYGPGDAVKPVIFNLGEACTADLTISLQDERGRTLEKKQIRAIAVPAGRSVTRLEPFRFKHKGEGTYFIVYSLRKSLQR